MLFSHGVSYGQPLFGAVLLLASSAGGTPYPEGLRIAAVGSCPSPAAVRSALQDLIPPGQEHAFHGGVEVELSDQGDGYTVAVRAPEKHAQKRYGDPANDCGKRARVAAVFVFLTVMPPELWGNALDEGPTPVDEPPEPEPSPPSPVVELPAQRPLVRLELGAVLEAAPRLGRAPAILAPGSELRTVLGRGTWAGFLSVGYVSASDFALPGLSARLWRAPVSAGARWHVLGNDWWLGIDGALHGQMQGVEATSPLHPNREAVLRWGTRWALTTGIDWGRVSPFLSLHATLLVDRRELQLLPQGSVGELPRVWLGATSGFALGL